MTRKLVLPPGHSAGMLPLPGLGWPREQTATQSSLLVNQRSCLLLKRHRHPAQPQHRPRRASRTPAQRPRSAQTAYSPASPTQPGLQVRHRRYVA